MFTAGTRKSDMSAIWSARILLKFRPNIRPLSSGFKVMPSYFFCLMYRSTVWTDAVLPRNVGVPHKSASRPTRLVN
jgi:hypothetical protein